MDREQRVTAAGFDDGACGGQGDEVQLIFTRADPRQRDGVGGVETEKSITAGCGFHVVDPGGVCRGGFDLVFSPHFDTRISKAELGEHGLYACVAFAPDVRRGTIVEHQNELAAFFGVDGGRENVRLNEARQISSIFVSVHHEARSRDLRSCGEVFSSQSGEKDVDLPPADGGWLEGLLIGSRRDLNR